MSKVMSLMALDITKVFLESPLEDEVYINYPPVYKYIMGYSRNRYTCLSGLVADSDRSHERVRERERTDSI